MKIRSLSLLLRAGFAGAFLLGLPLALPAQSASTYVTSANDKFNQGDYDAAIADYTKALELNSSYLGAYNGRGLARMNQGNFDGAVADFSQAIKLKPNFADSYLHRAKAEFLQGNLQGSIDDSSKLIEFRPDSQSGYFQRGLARDSSMDYDGAYADYGKALSSKSPEPEITNYVALHHALLAKRLGHASGDELKASAGWTDSWAKSLAGFLEGKISESELLKMADKPPGDDPTAQRCQALYFAGVVKLAGGDKAGAQAAFQQCVRLSGPATVAHRMAQSELDHH